MEKVAVLCEGGPIQKDNPAKYWKKIDRDLSIMTDILSSSGYKTKDLDIGDSLEGISDFSDKGESVFYYTGHANNAVFEGYHIQEVLNKYMDNKNKKVFIFDSCAGGDNLEELVLPENSSLITAKEVGQDSSIAMMLWDYVVARKKNLSNLSKQSFDCMKKNYIQFMEN